MAEQTSYREIIKAEYKKCSTSFEHFCKKYTYIQHPIRGKILFDVFDYQLNCASTFDDHEYTIVLKGRQIGLSTVVAMFCLYKMLFSADTNILIIATKKDTAKNIITKVTYAYENLPVWLRLPTIEKNKLSIRFKNGSQIKAVASSEDSARSEAVSYLILDEAAFIDNANEIWTAAQSTLSTGGHAILISTPNGIGNFFYQKYIEAEEFVGQKKTGVFHPIKLDWTVHPDRDQAWADKQKTILTPRGFKQEHEAEFLGSGNTFVDGELIEEHKQAHMMLPIKKLYRDSGLWIWKDRSPGSRYLVAADVGRGEDSEEGDYSAAHVLDVETCEQVAEYRGRLSTTEFAHILITLATEYNDALLVVENSNIGWATIQKLIDRGYPNLFYMAEDMKYVDPDNYKPTTVIGIEPEKSVAGFTTSRRTRPLILAKLEEFIRDNSVHIHSKRTIDELNTFIWVNGKPQAASGFKDDLVMSLAIGLWVRDTVLQLSTVHDGATRWSLSNFTRVSSYDSIYTGNVAPMVNPFVMSLPNGGEENILWVL